MDRKPRATIAYRRAVAGDIPALRSMHRASMGALGLAHYSPRQIAGLFLSGETVEPELIADATFFVATSGTRIVGSAAWTRRRPRYEAHLPGARTPHDGSAAIIRAVFVAPDSARQGIAGRLMDIVESEAVLRGATRLDLLATMPGVAFYQARGYRAETAVEVPLVNGIALPALRMTRQVLPEAIAA